MDPDPDRNFSPDPDPDPAETWIRRVSGSEILPKFGHFEASKLIQIGAKLGLMILTLKAPREYMKTTSDMSGFELL